MSVEFDDANQNINIPEINQSIIDSIELNDDGQISNVNEIIKINNDELEIALQNYQLTQEEKDQIFKEANESILNEDIEKQALKEDLVEYSTDFDKQESEIRKKIEQQQKNIETLGDLFNQVTKTSNDFVKIRQSEIEKLENDKNGKTQEIKEIENQISDALSEKDRLKEYESKDVSSLEKEPKDFEDTVEKTNKEIKNTYNQIKKVIPELYMLAKKDAPETVANNDENINDSLNQIKESIEEIINTMID